EVRRGDRPVATGRRDDGGEVVVGVNEGSSVRSGPDASVLTRISSSTSVRMFSSIEANDQPAIAVGAGVSNDVDPVDPTVPRRSRCFATNPERRGRRVERREGEGRRLLQGGRRPGRPVGRPPAPSQQAGAVAG